MDVQRNETKKWKDYKKAQQGHLCLLWHLIFNREWDQDFSLLRQDDDDDELVADVV